MRLGTSELLVILAIAILLFGGTRFANIGKSLGKGIREFKAEVKANDADPKAEQVETKA